MNLYASIKKNSLKESEETSFEEIIRDMENAEDYEDLYNAADKIVDIELRSKVKAQLKTCEEDKDSVSEAYSITTSDLLDTKVNDLNESNSELGSVSNSEAYQKLQELIVYFNKYTDAVRKDPELYQNEDLDKLIQVLTKLYEANDVLEEAWNMEDFEESDSNSEEIKKANKIADIVNKDKENNNTINRLKSIENQERYDKLYDRYKENGMNEDKIKKILGERPETGLEDEYLDNEQPSKTIKEFEDKQFVKTVKDFNGTLFNIYKTKDGRYVDANNQQLSKDELDQFDLKTSNSTEESKTKKALGKGLNDIQVETPNNEVAKNIGFNK